MEEYFKIRFIPEEFLKEEIVPKLDCFNFESKSLRADVCDFYADSFEEFYFVKITESEFPKFVESFSGLNKKLKLTVMGANIKMNSIREKSQRYRFSLSEPTQLFPLGHVYLYPAYNVISLPYPGSGRRMDFFGDEVYMYFSDDNVFVNKMEEFLAHTYDET